MCSLKPLEITFSLTLQLKSTFVGTIELQSGLSQNSWSKNFLRNFAITTCILKLKCSQKSFIWKQEFQRNMPFQTRLFSDFSFETRICTEISQLNLKHFLRFSYWKLKCSQNVLFWNTNFLRFFPSQSRICGKFLVKIVLAESFRRN